MVMNGSKNESVTLVGKLDDAETAGAKRVGVVVAAMGWLMTVLGFVALAGGFWLAWQEGSAPQALAAQPVANQGAADRVPTNDTPILAMALRGPNERVQPSLAEPYVAVIIDDLGPSNAALERVLALPYPVTASILPDAPSPAATANRVRAAGGEVFVHLPMEPEGLDDPGPMALLTWQSPEEIEARARAALDAVPGAVGVNNHMGSRFTACAACVDVVARVSAERDLMVVDSLTSPHSQWAQHAESHGAPALRRTVFLDHDREETAMRAALAEAERTARETGMAVVIGHPHADALAVLEGWMHDAADRGVAVGPVGVAVTRSLVSSDSAAA